MKLVPELKLYRVCRIPRVATDRLCTGNFVCRDKLRRTTLAHATSNPKCPTTLCTLFYRELRSVSWLSSRMTVRSLAQPYRTRRLGLPRRASEGLDKLTYHWSSHWGRMMSRSMSRSIFQAYLSHCVVVGRPKRFQQGVGERGRDRVPYK